MEQKRKQEEARKAAAEAREAEGVLFVRTHICALSSEMVHAFISHTLTFSSIPLYKTAEAKRVAAAEAAAAKIQHQRRWVEERKAAAEGKFGFCMLLL